MCADCATVAQLVEQLIRNQQVVGSSPISSSKYNSAAEWHTIFRYLCLLCYVLFSHLWGFRFKIEIQLNKYNGKY